MGWTTMAIFARITTSGWAIVYLCAAGHSAASGFVPIPLSGVANARLQATWPTFTGVAYPVGNQSWGGVPWQIPTTGNNTWFSRDIAGATPKSVVIPVNQSNVRSVYALMGTWQGTTIQTRFVDISVANSDGFLHTVRFFGGVDIRDWYNGAYTNSITSWKTTPSVYSVNIGPNGAAGTSRLDMQRIDLPPQFWWATLTSITIKDYSATTGGAQHAFLYGLTVSKDVRCPADLDGDGLVNDSDFVVFVKSYDALDCTDPTIPVRCQADFNGDGVVNDADFTFFVGAYDKLLCL